MDKVRNPYFESVHDWDCVHVPRFLISSTHHGPTKSTSVLGSEADKDAIRRHVRSTSAARRETRLSKRGAQVLRATVQARPSAPASLLGIRGAAHFVRLSAAALALRGDFEAPD